MGNCWSFNPSDVIYNRLPSMPVCNCLALRMKYKLLLALGVLSLAMILSTAFLRFGVNKKMFIVVGRQNDVEINKGVLAGVRSPPIEVQREGLPTRAEIQTEAEGTETHQTHKQRRVTSTPSSEEFSGRRTSVDRVRIV